MKKFSILLVGFICLMLSGCMFFPLSADIEIVNNTDEDIAYVIYYNSEIQTEADFVEAGKSVKRSYTGFSSEFDIKTGEDESNLVIHWLQKAMFDEKKEAQLENDHYIDDSMVLSEEYESPDGTTYPVGEYLSSNKFSKSYTITITQNGSSYKTEIRAN